MPSILRILRGPVLIAFIAGGLIPSAYVGNIYGQTVAEILHHSLSQVMVFGQAVTVESNQHRHEWFMLIASQADQMRIARGEQMRIAELQANQFRIAAMQANAENWQKLVLEAYSGNRGAQYLLGMTYLTDEEGQPNYAEALRWLELSADQGLSDAQLALGHLHRSGVVISQDFTESNRWFRLAAEQNHAEAQFYLGLAYAYGEGIAPDSVRGFEWIRQAAERGYAEAQYFAGLAYYAGIGTVTDEEAGFQMLLRAAYQGLVNAYLDVGKAYAAGRGIAEDDSLALQWFTSAVEYGDRHVIAGLGIVFQEGLIIADFATVYGLIGEKAEQGNPEAQAILYGLGEAFAVGRGVAEDDSLALEWFASGIAEGSRFMITGLGILLHEGLIEADFSTVYGLIGKLAEQGITEAQDVLFGVGEAFAAGEDDGLAMQWFTRGIAQGSRFMITGLGKIWLEGHIADSDRARARDMIRELAEAGIPEAQVVLGEANELVDNIVEAFAWFFVAGQLGLTDAENRAAMLLREMDRSLRDRARGRGHSFVSWYSGSSEN